MCTHFVAGIHVSGAGLQHFLHVFLQATHVLQMLRKLARNVNQLLDLWNTYTDVISLLFLGIAVRIKRSLTLASLTDDFCAAFSSCSAACSSFSSVWMRFRNSAISRRISSLMSAPFPPVPLLLVPPVFITSASRFIRRFSSLYVCSWRFHSSTLAVDSCRALVNRMLLLFSVDNSISHFFALAQLRHLERMTEMMINLRHLFPRVYFYSPLRQGHL